MTDGKKDILIIMGRYLPGYKDGGPVRSIKNLVEYLGNDYNLKILTCDRDHGDTEPYPNIKIHDWNQVENAKVYYVPPNGFTLNLILKLSKQVDLVYVCGCFNNYAIKTLLLKRMGILKEPLVIAAMGLFSPMEFKIKYLKKKAYITLCNITGMFKKVYWSASSEMEISEISKEVKTHNNFFIAEDLPRRVDISDIRKVKKEKLKIVWISRIAPKKNLKGAIEILSHVKSEIEFTIYGPIHMNSYWEECREELSKLPSNITWKYEGSVDSENVIDVLKSHHLFLFPTLGENYGHVIHEALSAGCIVVLSDQTPWRDIDKLGIGKTFSLQEVEKFVNAIEDYANMETELLQSISSKALRYASEYSDKKKRNSGYHKIFTSNYNSI